jgi:metal-sulfur cluster biosynthetic enzyme
VTWKVVIDLGLPYDVEVENGRIVIPFHNTESCARFAAGQVRVTVEQDRPVIGGSVIAGEIEGNDDHDQQQ